MAGLLGLWWPVPLLLAAVIVTQTLWFGRYDARGHCALRGRPFGFRPRSAATRTNAAASRR